MARTSAQILDEEDEDPLIGGAPAAESLAVADAPPPGPGDELVAPEAEPAPILDLAPPDAAGTTTPDDAITAALEPGPPVIPANEPLPDLTPTAVAPLAPEVAMPPGSRQHGQHMNPSPTDVAIMADEAKAADAAVIAAQNASNVKQRGMAEEEKLAAENAVKSREHERRVQQAIEDHDLRLESALAKKQQLYDDARAMPFHDLYAERSTGDRVIGAIAIFLGGLGGGQNQAMQILDTRMKAAYDKQAKDIEGKWKLYELQSKNIEEARRGKDDALSDLKTLQSARYEAAADHLAQLKVRQGIPAEQAQLDKDVVAIRAKANPYRKEVAEKTRELVEWDTYGKHRGTGGGGGAGIGSAAEKLAKRIEDGVVGPDGARRPLSHSEMIHAANDLRVPIEGKGDQVSLAKIMKESTFNADQARKDRGKGGTGGDDKAINSRMDKYENQAVGTARTMGPVRVLSAVEAMRHGLEEAAESGDSDRIKAAAIKAKEQAGTLMSGGKLTNAQIAILHELESSTDTLVSKIGKFTGNPTEGKGLIKRLTNLIDDAGTEYVEQIKDIRQRGINEHLGPGGLADTAEKKRTFLNRNTGLYSAVKWKGKPVFDEGKDGAGAHSGGEEKPKAAGVEVPGDPAERTAKAQRALAALNDPAKTAAQKAKARDYLISIGARK